jgi:hypothetical protein
MIISDENNILMFAILSMDVYNRDSNNTPAVIYGALNASAGSANGPVSLGNARLISTSYNDTTLFGAASYNVSGQIVVAYRGTVFDSFWHEAWNGYGVGAGSPTGPQAQEAITFYQKVANSLPNFNGNYATANIMLTGHSLGGGLAGFIGALYGQQGVLFDNMPFEKAASNAFAYSVGFPIDPTLGLPGGAEPDAALAKEIYGSTSPYPDNIKNLARIMQRFDDCAAKRSRRVTEAVPCSVSSITVT